MIKCYDENVKHQGFFQSMYLLKKKVLLSWNMIPTKDKISAIS